MSKLIESEHSDRQNIQPPTDNLIKSKNYIKRQAFSFIKVFVFISLP